MFVEILFTLCLFGTIATATWLVARHLLSETDGRLRARLRAGDIEVIRMEQSLRERIEGALEQLVHTAGSVILPKSREGQAALRQKLGYAGVYSSSGLTFLLGCRVLLVVGLGFLGSGIGYLQGNTLMGFSVAGFVGYLLPNLWLAHRIKVQKKALEKGLPDALDLLVICVESGLTVDSAIQRVGQELSVAHPRLSQEFEITHMETRVGLARSEAMRNLARRTGSLPLQALSTMLIQSERFGTSIANALRIHAESLRVTRQHQAEEMAAKASVKISFPVVLFIFPAVLIVLGGPALIGLFRSALFTE